MKTFVAAALVALGVLSTAVAAAHADSNTYPDWAKTAFENKY
ncbi:MAG TPA: hypothetical protein VFZ16_10840 [Hyphomicrobiaceae bacterium]|nr:hypothetical protein [Hyphomicrobiaceae bacterium]HEX5999872.1 hypothetical protein [Hyphomicrobiaceae bacterium]